MGTWRIYESEQVGREFAYQVGRKCFGNTYQIVSKMYRKYTRTEKGIPIFYVELKKVLYETLQYANMFL